jgi:hypothetical protein
MKSLRFAYKHFFYEEVTQITCLSKDMQRLTSQASVLINAEIAEEPFPYEN